MSRFFTIPQALLEETERALVGPSNERTALWQMAEPEDHVGTVVGVVVPAQTAHASAFGHLVHVAGAELVRIQFEAHRAGRRTWIQIHTHPGRNVAMSDLDRRWAIADFDGALSIIVPWFGRSGLSGFPGVAVHERTDRGWRRWRAGERARRLRVTP
jgi:hypothetical protein